MKGVAETRRRERIPPRFRVGERPPAGAEIGAVTGEANRRRLGVAIVRVFKLDVLMDDFRWYCCGLAKPSHPLLFLLGDRKIAGSMFSLSLSEADASAS